MLQSSCNTTLFKNNFKKAKYLRRKPVKVRQQKDISFSLIILFIVNIVKYFNVLCVFAI